MITVDERSPGIFDVYRLDLATGKKREKKGEEEEEEEKLVSSLSERERKLTISFHFSKFSFFLNFRRAQA